MTAMGIATRVLLKVEDNESVGPDSRPSARFDPKIVFAVHDPV